MSKTLNFSDPHDLATHLMSLRTDKEMSSCFEFNTRKRDAAFKKMVRERSQEILDERNGKRKPVVRDTSIQAYLDMIKTGKAKTQKDIVYFNIYTAIEPMTRNELHQRINSHVNQHNEFRLSSMTARVKELIDEGVLEDSEKRPCKVTGLECHVLKIVNEV